MLTFLNNYAENKKYSQNGEEGILIECLKRIGMEWGDLTYRCCEFGAHNGRYCSNTRLLIENLGFSGMMIESDYMLFSELKKGINRLSICPVHSDVIPDNINQLLSSLPYSFDVLSIDTDGDNDYNCFDAIRFEPKIVIVEIDSSIHPDIVRKSYDAAKSINLSPNRIFTSYYEMVSLGIKKGYFLLCHTGNLIFVLNKYRELFPEIIGNGIDNSELYFNKSWLKA